LKRNTNIREGKAVLRIKEETCLKNIISMNKKINFFPSDGIIRGIALKDMFP
jgi:hypothetical protein